MQACNDRVIGFSLRVAPPITRPGEAPIRFLETDAGESNPRVSPDGRWVAYESDESGEPEIHVRPFPSGNGRAVVSLSGGRYPRWRGDSRELFFWEPNGGITATTLQSIDSLDFDLPVRVLAERSAVLGPTILRFGFDVSADGQRFVVLTPLGDSIDTGRLILVEKWFEEFNQAMAAGQG